MFYGFVITESGNALLASMVAGQTMTITKAVVGEGTADNPDAARKLTDLITPGPTATSTRPTVDGNSVNMIVEYRSDLNGGLKEGFWIGEFGIFGKVGDGEEAMIGYGSLGDAKQYVSAYVEGTAPDVRRYPVSITVTTGVQVNVDYPAEAWMTAEDVDDKVNKHNSSEESHQDIRASLSNKADITPPQEFLLPLPEGWSGTIQYSKTQDSMVTLYVAISKETAIGSGTFSVGTLPSGYYPSQGSSCACVNVVPGATAPTASRLIVGASGELLVQQPDTAAIGFVGSITFIANE